MPAVLISEAGEEPRVLISAEELDAMADLRELIAMLGRRFPSPSKQGDALPEAA